MIIVELAGIMAAAFSVVTFVPQAVKTYRLRQDSHALAGVSKMMLWCLTGAQTCWAIYGIGLQAYWTAAPAFLIAPLALFMLFVIYRSERA